jgi:hypothetical protein
VDTLTDAIPPEEDAKVKKQLQQQQPEPRLWQPKKKHGDDAQDLGEPIPDKTSTARLSP